MAKKEITDEYHSENNPKQGHIVCGLCDTRRAVIGLDVLIIIFYLICIAFYGFQTAIEFVEEFDGIDSVTQNHWIVLASLGVGLLCSISGIYGALRYNSILSFIAAGWFSLNAFFNIIQWDVIGAVAMVLCAYPHVYLYQELKEDIMSKEKYQDEVYCVCCA